MRTLSYPTTRTKLLQRDKVVGVVWEQTFLWESMDVSLWLVRLGTLMSFNRTRSSRCCPTSSLVESTPSSLSKTWSFLAFWIFSVYLLLSLLLLLLWLKREERRWNQRRKPSTIAPPPPTPPPISLTGSPSYHRWLADNVSGYFSRNFFPLFSVSGRMDHKYAWEAERALLLGVGFLTPFEEANGLKRRLFFTTDIYTA